MKSKTRQRIRGSITVLMVIIMLPMMTLSAVIVDSSRINMARSMVSAAGDLTMNTALANYDTILKDVYGLFAMSQNKTDDELAAECKDYFQKTLTAYGVTNEAESGQYVDALLGDVKEIISGAKDEAKSGDFLNMNILDDFSVTKVDGSALSESNILRSQIIEYMKYRAPLNFGLSFLDSLSAFKNVEAQTNVVKSQVKAQESTQDVTKACKNAITSIREFDKLIDSMNTNEGENAVKGKNTSSDGQLVKIDQYYSQIDKYKESWTPDYTHINMLNLVFCQNAPTTNDKVLKSLNNNVVKNYFISNSNGNWSVVSVSNLINPALAGSTTEAKQQVEAQIEKLAGTPYTVTANTYFNKAYVSNGNITLDLTSFKNEDAAVSTFIEYEKFLSDKSSDVNYTDVKNTLQEIYSLSKYFENYRSKIQGEINSAQMNLENAQKAEDLTREDINKMIGAINSSCKNCKLNYDFLSDDLKARFETLKSSTISVLNENSEISNVMSRMKENSGDTENKYRKLFKDITAKADSNNLITKAANDYLNNSKLSGTFSIYVRDEAGLRNYENDELYQLLNFLDQNDSRAVAISGYKDDYTDSHGKASKAQGEVESKTRELRGIKSQYENTLSEYKKFTDRYQTNLYYYDKYIEAAKNTISNETAKISAQYKKIEENVKSIVDKLADVNKKLADARTAIVTYQQNVSDWNTANNSYKLNNANDSFAQQNESDISATKNQYNLDSLDELKQYVGKIKEQYDNLYSAITDSKQYTYGEKRIRNIENVKDVISATGYYKSSLPDIVTVDNANSSFSALYKGGNLPEIDFSSVIVTGSSNDGWQFLKPQVANIQFLKYLNTAYPDEGDLTEAEKNSNKEAEEDYNTQKDQLKEDHSGSSVDEGETKNEDGSNKFGYSYESKSVSEDSLPSKNQTKQTVNEGDLKIEETDGKLNASDSIGSQSDTLSKMLGGLKSIANSTLENTYILSYIFENFSYNTLIQDKVIEEKGDEASTLGIAQNILNSNYKDYLGKSKTLSNFSKNQYNNYLYGGEIEYILYGNTNPAKNVTYAKASIYAIRFVFNCIHAFTDTEIRNTTMAAGLAVQAATLGVVPYQVVQVILQLALAAAESAIDLQKMNTGLKVAVVKTKETWSLSLSNAAKTVADVVAVKAAEAVDSTIDKISSGLQNIVDSTADNINDSIKSLTQSLTDATTQKLQEIVDSSASEIKSVLEEQLNSLQCFNYEDKAAAKQKVSELFDGLSDTLKSKLESKFGDNETARVILPSITDKIVGVVDGVKDDILNKINIIPTGEDITSAIIGKVDDIKSTIIDKVDSLVENMRSIINNKVTALTDDVKNDINAYITDKGEKLSEEASEKIKTGVTNKTNEFIDKYLSDDKGFQIGSSGNNISASASSSIASIIKFGYKDYLMLFTFIALYVNDGSAILSRTADIIQMNIQNASTSAGAEFQHKKSTGFKMTEAKTYISMEGSVKLDMLFLNMDFFANVMSDGQTQVEGQLTPAATIKYKGLYGY